MLNCIYSEDFIDFDTHQEAMTRSLSFSLFLCNRNTIVILHDRLRRIHVIYEFEF